jgi:multidrug efflux pump subunit AcrA (membrane-fusion protein)
MTKRKIFIGSIFVLLLASGVTASYKKFSKPSEQATHSHHDENGLPQVSVITLGQSDTPENSLNIGSGVSWSGEILSATDVNIQPKREGTIAEWDIKIGQKVYQGQTLGRLSSPPKTPDVVQAIAAQAEALTRAKADAQATESFNQKKIDQLTALKKSYSNLKNVYSTSGATGNTDSLIQTKKDNIRVVLQGSISKIYPTISANGTNPNANYQITLLWNIGILGSNKNNYPGKVQAALKDLQSKDIIPEESGMAYFETTLKVLNESVPDGALDTTALANLKSIVTTEQQEFVAAIKEYKQTLVDSDTKVQEIAGKNQDVINKNQDIDGEIIQLEKNLALANAEVAAKQVSYNTVVGGLTGGLEIIATKSGTISTISKQVGEFVHPEDTLASINGGNNNEKLIRFRIPSNGIAPKSGDLLTVARPGFLDTKVKIQVIGVGISLDTNGSYMADAKFVETVDWPVHALVRVIPSTTSTESITIPFTAIFWTDDGTTKVWTVTTDNRLLSKKITAGRTFGDTVEVTLGLSNGERVVTHPIQDMKDGLQVEVTDISLPQENSTTNKTDVHDESKPHSHDE